MPTEITLNGAACTSSADAKTFLLTVLRNEFGLSGPKFGCGAGECGACMVLLDGKPVPSCDMPLWAAEGKSVVTLEGLGTPEHPHAIQQALLDEQAGQCGYCLAGIAISAAALLEANTRPSRADICTALERNLCRCGSHNRIIRAVERAAAQLRETSHA
ncbi:MAG: (2Fe-2S)-binding protein [Pseudomonadota bacterium]